MPSVQKSSMNHSSGEENIPAVSVLGVIAGGGDIPARLLQVCDERSVAVFIVALKGHTKPEILSGRAYLWSRIGKAGEIIETLKSRKIKDLVFIGSVKRPSLSELRPDFKTAKFFTRVGLQALGDDGILRALKSELEKEGFTLHGVHEFVQDLLTPEGPIGKYSPLKTMEGDIVKGIEVSQKLGALDIGQSVIVQQGIILGVEAVEGTDSLIRRAALLKRKGRGPILVKSCKPKQDKDFDLPTIGPDTVKLAVESGFSGIIIESGNSLIVNREEVAQIADRHKLFVCGMRIDKNGR